MSITSRINEIETHLKEDYTNLEALGYDIPQDKNIENIASVLDNVWENQSHIEETGTTLSMNTNKGKAKVDLLGNTYQETTTGKNLLDTSNSNLKFKATDGSITKNGDNVSIGLSGATYNFGIYLIGNINDYKGKTLTFSLKENTSSTFAACRFVNCDASGNNRSNVGNTSQTLGANTSLTLTIPDTTYDQDYLAFRLYADGTSGNSYVIKEPMLEQSSTPTSYEPYTNGASPNPDYPQDIHVVSGDNTITSCGRNLAYTGWAEDFVARINDSNKATITTKDNRRCLYWIASAGYPNYDTKYTFTTNWKENTQYTISFDLFTNSTNGYGDICIEYTDGTKQEINGTYNTWVHKTTTSTSGKTIKNIHTYYRAESSYIDLDTFMVEEGTSESPYEPYVSSSYQVNLPVENLAKQVFDTKLSVAGSGDVRTCQTSNNNCAEIIEVKSSTKYTISGDFSVLKNGTMRVAMFNTSPTNGSTSTKVSTSTTSFTLETDTNTKYLLIWNGNDVNTTMSDLQVEEGTKQNSFTPYGTTPIELCEIGTYKDGFIRNSGKNILNRATCDENKALSWSNGTTFNDTDGLASDYIKVSANEKYALNYRSQFMFYDKDKTYLGCIQSGGTTIAKATGIYDNKVTIPNIEEIYYMRLGFRATSNNNANMTIANIMLNLGDTTLPYEPYGKGDWYLHKEIGNAMLNGEEANWTEYTNTASGLYKAYTTSVKVGRTNDYEVDGYSNYFDILNAFSQGSTYINMALTKNATYLSLPSSIASSIESLRTWLGTHNTEIKYILATPTYTKIEGTLASQLEDVWRANTYDNQTNVSQVNNDLPFELYFKALGTPSNTLLGLSRNLQLNNPIENVEEIEESGDLDGENQENI